MEAIKRTSLASQISVKCCKGFNPPRGLLARIRSALSWIDPSDLEGIGFVFLFDDVPPIEPGSNPDAEKSIREGLLLFAAYKAKSPIAPAHIMLIVRNLYKPVPRVLHRSPALTLWIAENIAHEVGHHVIKERRFRLRPTGNGSELENGEDFADRFAASVVKRMKSRPVYKFGGLLLGLGAQLNYYKGMLNWKQRKYRAAEEWFYLATQLQRDHRGAAYWFWKAYEKSAH